ncbi:MAG: hypothetical protein WC707_05735 [Candidatus Babeliaceae bacterium]|jgi:hypothetical protein
MKRIFKLLLFSSYFLLSAQADISPMQPAFVLEIINKLARGENVIFVKYGDGEYNCMVGRQDCNADGDSYHSWLGNSLQRALISLAHKPNTYIGKWWNANVYEAFDEFARQNSVTIPWAWYHMVINDDESLKIDYMHKFVDFIIHAKRKKILICNSTNARIKDFLRADVYIEIPPRNWSFEYNAWKKIIESHIEQDAIVLISAGMCAKVLVDDLTNAYNITCVDLGCSFDILGGKKNTRGWAHSYQDELVYYQDLLPQNWD